MMNLANLIKNLERHGINYQVQDCEKYEGRIKIGVPTQRGEVYYWFYFYAEEGVEITGEEYVFFIERYNRNNGYRLRSASTCIRFQDDLRLGTLKRHKKDGIFDYVHRRTSNGLVGNGVNPLIS